jgi:hypothetical protein
VNSAIDAACEVSSDFTEFYVLAQSVWRLPFGQQRVGGNRYRAHCGWVLRRDRRHRPTGR